MGGCRCSFRDCKVNTYKQTRMHFFHFPLKNAERYRKWREYAKTEEMLGYAEVKKKNMVVCARHFRIEYFMNYKMDRLTQHAIPTIMRLSNTRALDYEQDLDNGVLITLEEPKHKHLLAPKDFECPLDLDTDEDLFNKLTDLESEITGPKVESLNLEFDELRDFGGLIGNTLNTSTSIVQTKIQNVEKFVATDLGDCDRIKAKPLKSSSNTVHILETIQVSAPHSKRPRTEVEQLSEAKKMILNTQQTPFIEDTAIDFERKCERTIIVPLSRSFQSASGIIISEIENHPTLQQTEFLDQDVNVILGHDTFNDSSEDDDDNVEFIEIHNDDAEIEDEFETNDPNSTIVQYKSDLRQNHLRLQETITTKHLAAQREVSAIRKHNSETEVLQAKISLLEKENLELKEMLKEKKNLKNKLLSSQLENSHMKNSINDIKDELQKSDKENEILKQISVECDSLKDDLLSRNKKIKELEKVISSYIASNLKDKEFIEHLELELIEEREKHLQTEKRLQKQILTLEQSLEISRQQLTTTKNTLSSVKSNINDLQLEKLNLSKQQMEIEQSLQLFQNNYVALDHDYQNLKVNYDGLQQKYSNLEQKYGKLEALQNQVATVTTSLENSSKLCQPSQVSLPSANSLTKAHLFNAIKRYVSASMVSLLRMEMFGSSEREWKTDERQVAVDLLLLGETVYKYLTDEWRFRLPALRDVRNWLSQSVEVDDEEDL